LVAIVLASGKPINPRRSMAHSLPNASCVKSLIALARLLYPGIPGACFRLLG
jgi:hypothetical protein